MCEALLILHYITKKISDCFLSFYTTPFSKNKYVFSPSIYVKCVGNFRVPYIFICGNKIVCTYLQLQNARNNALLKRVNKNVTCKYSQRLRISHDRICI